MDNEVKALALNPVALALLAQHPQLSPALRRQLDQAVQKLVRVAEVTKAKQDALSAIHLHAVWKAHETLTLAELIRLCRSPGDGAPELAALTQALREQYVEQVQHIVSCGADTIVASRLDE